MKKKTVKPKREQESSQAFFHRVRPKFLDWQPPTQEEHLQAMESLRKERETQLEKVLELAKVGTAEKKLAPR